MFNMTKKKKYNVKPEGPSEKHILLCVATYNGHVHQGLLPAVTGATRTHETSMVMLQSSASAHAFNQMLCMALNGRKENGYTHFCLIHHDIEPEPFFLDKMVEIMESNRPCDFLQVVVPIKDPQGLTSTAMDEPPPGEGWDPRWTVRRLTMREVFNMPPTFSHPKLLVNNGLILIDLRAKWLDKACFKMDTDVLRRNGRFYPVMFSEDWQFSRQANANGAKIYATREVPIIHHGVSGYGNMVPWGSLETDNPEPPAVTEGKIQEALRNSRPIAPQGGHRDSSEGIPGTAV